MAGDLLFQRVIPAYGGQDHDSAPESIREDQGPLVENFLVDRPGVMPLRGPLNEASILYQSGPGAKPVGLWSHGDKLLVGLKATTTVGAEVDPWVSPYRKPLTAATLAAGHNTLYFADLNTNALTAIAATADQVPGPRFTRLGGYVYGIGYDVTDAANIVLEGGGYQKRRKLLRWDGTAVAPVVHSVAPAGAQDIRAHYQRLFVLGGQEPGTAGAMQPNTLWWSDQHPTTGALPDTIASWQNNFVDPAITEYLVVDVNDPDDYGVALAKLGANLAIFKRRSIHVLYGYSSGTFQIKTFSSEQGCLDARSIVEYEDGVFFMSDQGYMWFDGAELVNVTSNLKSTLLTQAIGAVGDLGADGGRVVAGKLPNGYLGLSIGTSPASSVESSTTFCAMYHVGRRAWVNFSTDVLPTRKPTHWSRSVTKSFIVDDTRIVKANKLTSPEADPQLRGIDSAEGLFRFAVVDASTTFSGVTDSLRNTESGVEMFPSAATNYAIPAKWYSRLIKLSTPLSLSQLHRYLQDYNFQLASGADESGSLGSGWFVTLLGGDGTVLLAEYQLPVQGQPTVYTYRRRNTQDLFTEAADLQVRIEWRGTAAPALQRAELLEGTIEFTRTRERRST